MLNIRLIGRIDELESINSAFALLNYMHQVAGGCYVVKEIGVSSEVPGNLADDQGNPFEDFGELQRMYVPLGLMPGTYMVTGIEGKHYNGYNDPDEVAWPLEVTEGMSAYDIMMAVAASEANGYPDVNHVWFEFLTIDVLALTLKFSMGS
jgi:hypothetical protein